MNSIAQSFESNGYAVLNEVLSELEITEIELNLEAVTVGKAGTRNLLFFDWCGRLAQSLKLNSVISPLVLEETVAVQCTYFPKSSDWNWLVTLHRDYSIPVKNRVNASGWSGWSGWSKKEGIIYARPPAGVLKALVAIRLHLEDNTHQNSPLQVVPSSHKHSDPYGISVSCLVSKGGVVVMRPLLLHSSSKLTESSRRVLHFLYGP